MREDAVAPRRDGVVDRIDRPAVAEQNAEPVELEQLRVVQRAEPFEGGVGLRPAPDRVVADDGVALDRDVADNLQLEADQATLAAELDAVAPIRSAIRLVISAR